jgi:glycosyltransferase involved in cell wall biosynthesis
MHGAVIREKVPDLYKKAACLCSTSDHEGFPNTFLEAWSYGIPLITTFDPDQTVAEKGLGAVASDVPGLARSIRELLASPDLWKSASVNARQYYIGNHSIERILPRFEQVFRDVLMK